MAELKKRVPPKKQVMTFPTGADIPDTPMARCIPRNDRVVVRRDISQKNETPGGILLPDSFANDKQQTGTVWAVGPGKLENGERVPMDLEVGQRVIITGWAGLEIQDPMNSGKKADEFVLLREDDVVAVLPPA